MGKVFSSYLCTLIEFVCVSQLLLTLSVQCKYSSWFIMGAAMKWARNGHTCMNLWPAAMGVQTRPSSIHSCVTVTVCLNWLVRTSSVPSSSSIPFLCRLLHPSSISSTVFAFGKQKRSANTHSIPLPVAIAQSTPPNCMYFFYGHVCLCIVSNDRG